MEGVKDGGVSHMKREVDSVDDFEHLGHDSSPLKETLTTDTNDLVDLLGVQAPARDIRSEIDARVEAAGIRITDSFDPLKDLLDKPLVPQKMDSNLLEMGDNNKLDRFDTKPDKYDINAFMASERGGFIQDQPKTQSANDLLDRYTDSEPEEDDFRPSKYEDFPKKHELPESFGSTENFNKSEAFKDVEDAHPQLPKKDGRPTVPAPEPPTPKEKAPVAPEKTPDPISLHKPPTEIAREKSPEPVKISADKPKIPEPVKPKTPEPPVIQKVEEVKNKVVPEVVETGKKADEKIGEKKPKIAPAADAEAIFCKMGLDTWFNPDRLDPKVESLIYWRDPKKSGPVFGGVLLILLSLTYFSLISVVAYLSLISLSGTLAFRIYKNVVQAVQKTGDGHPFKEALEMDVALPQDKVKEISEVAVAHINAAVVELRRLFLVEDLVDSIKFGVLLWTLTYLGAWFNGMTLIIIAWVALFSLPKVYETNKTQIDANLEIVRTKLAEITSKVKAAIPIGKKAEEKKEQ